MLRSDPKAAWQGDESCVLMYPVYLRADRSTPPLSPDGTEGAKAIEDQRKAKAAREAEKESESETTRSRGGLRQQPASLPDRSSGLKLICN